jgi:DNA polymerase-3 subunit alpha
MWDAAAAQTACCALKITDVDPIELNLYFERFINPKRTSRPISTLTIRGKTGMVQDTSSNYGRKHTALLGTVSARDRSVFRELGKVYGLLGRKSTGLLIILPVLTGMTLPTGCIRWATS